MARIEQSTVRNRLLKALAPEDFALLAGSLQRVELKLKQVLYQPDERIEAVWFPETGLVSMLAHLEDGDSQEIGIVGREGLAGLPVILGSDTALDEAMVQLPGTALHLPPAVLREAFEAKGGLRNLLLRYIQAFHAQVAQTAVCNNHHALEERLARWLLLSHDRAGSDVFTMTQEFMATMLGVRRPGVTLAAGILQKSGVISYERRQITILDRRGLEATACECYRVVQQRFTRLLP